MKLCEEYIKGIEEGIYNQRLTDVYVNQSLIPYHKERYIKAIKRFIDIYGEKEIEIYSAPGRSEVSGNHTDHQHGHVLATSINLDAIGIVSMTNDNIIHLVSGDSELIEISVDDLEIKADEMETTAALIRGVAAGLVDKGYKVGGFEVYVTSDVLMGAGMSSSAAFETLIGTILSGLYNDMQVSSVEIAKIGQYAENVYFGKPCGLMDQMACSVGGLVYIDFEDVKNPIIKQVPSDFEGNSYSLCITDTMGSHADLTDAYAAIPREMKQVAEFFGKSFLREISKEEFLSNISKLRESVTDRAVLRALHFYTEQDRVAEAVSALEQDDYDAFLSIIKASGDSSSKLLQNIYNPQDPDVQNVTLALGLSQYYLGENGISRVHGGGFAGTIQAFVKNDAVNEYQKEMNYVFGQGACSVLKIRKYGGIKVI